MLKSGESESSEVLLVGMGESGSRCLVYSSFEM